MRRDFLLILFICLLCFTCSAQQNIKPEDAAKYLGDSVTVCGKIYGGKFLENAKNQPTFLNIGAAYPNQLLTIVIWGDTRKLFPYKPEEELKDKTVCINGRIDEFKGKPQIVIYSPVQLQEK